MVLNRHSLRTSVFCRATWGSRRGGGGGRHPAPSEPGGRWCQLPSAAAVPPGVQWPSIYLFTCGPHSPDQAKCLGKASRTVSCSVLSVSFLSVWLTAFLFPSSWLPPSSTAALRRWLCQHRDNTVFQYDVLRPPFPVSFTCSCTVVSASWSRGTILSPSSLTAEPFLGRESPRHVLQSQHAFTASLSTRNHLAAILNPGISLRSSLLGLPSPTPCGCPRGSDSWPAVCCWVRLGHRLSPLSRVSLWTGCLVRGGLFCVL